MEGFVLPLALRSRSVFGYGTLDSRLVQGCAMWVGLELEGSRIGVLNIYASTNLQRKATF